MYQLFTTYVVVLIIYLVLFNVANSQLKQSGDTVCFEYEVCMDISKCHTHFKNSEDVARSCGRGKVFCRNNSKGINVVCRVEQKAYLYSKSLFFAGNPCEIFQKNGHS